MRRPWQIWLAFALCLAVTFTATGWVSVTVLRLDSESSRRTFREENVRLALWRMDSAATSLIAQESARPYFHYTSFYPAERAYTRMYAEIRGGEILVPSPLLIQPPSPALVHFQFGPDGSLTSPQAPTGNMRDLAETGSVTPESVDEATRMLHDLTRLVDRRALLAVLTLPAAAHSAATSDEDVPLHRVRAPQQEEPPEQLANLRARDPEGQMLRSRVEWRARSQAVENASVVNDFRRPSPGVEARKTKTQSVEPAGRPVSVRQGAMRLVWVERALLLARRASVNGEEYVQGCLLDWPALKEWLLDGISDLLPEADLVPAESGPSVEGERMLASLPARLKPGKMHLPSLPFITPIRVSLVVAWVCVLAAALAVGALLAGVISLSERRADFVSAVTHELRTPLTTFRMYAEMLAEGMVEDTKRVEYLETLRTEADRLGHLVENVLAYARLERGRATGHLERIPLDELLQKVRGLLASRAARAGMSLVIEAAAGGSSRRVRTDVTIVEQILFNLVDNACKYAAAAEDKRIHIETAVDAKNVLMRVRDHGPGVSGTEARRLFRPFSKSAREAANSAPGVGLGLALSRRLARRIGGELRLEQTGGPGASFVLTLPTT